MTTVEHAGLTALDTVIDAAQSGRPRALGRLISWIENGDPRLREVMAALAPTTGRAHVVGLTGPPGVGKSTATAALVRVLRSQGLRVGVLAVDPSSPFTGGALLGDRVRMQEHATDPGVYIRSMASRGHLGGLSVVAPQALRVFDLAGFDVVLLETVGVGQSEVEVASVADTAVVVLAPGTGDGVQAAKAGVLEIADVFVVNKSDREGAQAMVRELRGAVALTERAPGEWKPPVLTAVAVSGEGISELWTRIADHRVRTEASGRWQAGRESRARREVEELALARLRAGFARQGAVAAKRSGEVAAEVAAGTLDPYTAADRLLAVL